jgi:uncharacterized membrane protein
MNQKHEGIILNLSGLILLLMAIYLIVGVIFAYCNPKVGKQFFNIIIDTSHYEYHAPKYIK